MGFGKKVMIMGAEWSCGAIAIGLAMEQRCSLNRTLSKAMQIADIIISNIPP